MKAISYANERVSPRFPPTSLAEEETLGNLILIGFDILPADVNKSFT
jgi:hypothetical protein